MKRNFPKLIALSLILSLSVTPIANAESNSNIKAKDKKHVLMSRTRVFLLTYVI